ncbi:Bro-N domain-containing protein, partial [Bacillus licheniformis]|uniref:BRO-N domain-containing protein n=1 Tax=Bacillus licheniformis TaxID=1402 RepID=UPI002E1E2117|nr:BRO family protein [Bacillus licheniformis]
MNQLQIFSNKEFGSLPIVYIENKVYFGATETATTLGYANPHDAISKHCKKEGVAFHEVLSNGGPQRKKFINEGNLYRLISRSKLPSAVNFVCWVFVDVIASMRNWGGFVAFDDL